LDHLIFGHLVMGVAALAATLATSALSRNTLVKRKLRLSVALLAAYLLVHLAMLVRLPGLTPDLDAPIRSFENLALAAALINLVVVGAVNPLRHDRVPDTFPSILQDAIVIGLFALVASLFFHDQLLTTSAIGAAVVGFALQDTLGNAFAGLAIQSEKPFRIGHWVKVGEYEGRVQEVTWRATRLRTKEGNWVVLPNNVVSREPIVNYSEPAAPSMIEVRVGASYMASPTSVKAALAEALTQAPRALRQPAPDLLLDAFDGSAITYRVRFWILDREQDDQAADQVRTAIFHAFARHGLEIPWPIQIEYSREWPAPASGTAGHRRSIVDGVDLFARLSEEQRTGLADQSVFRTFGDGETIVRQGEPGRSMFVVSSGRAAVILDGSHEVAQIPPGGYFGEMSLLTGEPRTATVVARGDTSILELDAELFRQLGAADPQALEQVALAAASRRAELEQAREAARAGAASEPPATLLARMKRFLGLS
jgi:small-conductance mechanosensitive channel/CRP-like cAMP-binding protein